MEDGKMVTVMRLTAADVGKEASKTWPWQSLRDGLSTPMVTEEGRSTVGISEVMAK